MKNSISNIWILGLVIAFILIFSAFIIITINYNKVFKMKNTLLTIIEKKDGVTRGSIKCGDTSAVNKGASICTGAGSLETMSIYLYAMNYQAHGNCPNDGNTWYGVNIGDAPENSEITSAGNGTFNYCLAREDSEYHTSFFKVRLFFYMDLPIIGNLIPINVDGTTGEIYNVSANNIV